MYPNSDSLAITFQPEMVYDILVLWDSALATIFEPLCNSNNQSGDLGDWALAVETLKRCSKSPSLDFFKIGKFWISFFCGWHRQWDRFRHFGQCNRALGINCRSQFFDWSFYWKQAIIWIFWAFGRLSNIPAQELWPKFNKLINYWFLTITTGLSQWKT